MRKSARMVLALGLALSGSTFAAYAWKSVVIGGGGYVPGFVTHPTVKGLMYARTDMGGAYRWHAPSSSWLPITDWMTGGANDMGILSIALDPRDGAKVALLTGKYTASWGGMGNVQISTDTGKTFRTTPLHLKVGGNQTGRNAGERLAFDPNLGTTLYLASNPWDSVYYGATTVTTTFQGSIWKSIDGGKTFDSLKTAPRGDGMFVVIDPNSAKPGVASKTIYTSFGKSNNGLGAIWRSLDAGASWSLLPGQPDSVVGTNATLVGDDLWITFNQRADQNSSGKGQIWRYQITSGAWTNVTPPTGSGFGTVAVSRQNPSILVVGTICRWAWENAGQKYGGDGVWMSRDKGATWKVVTPTNDFANAGTIDNSPTPWKSIRGPHWISGVAIDPFDSTVALYGTGAGVYRTTDLFSPKPTWAAADSNFEELVSTQVISPPSGAPLLTSAGDQGGFRHERLDRSPNHTHTPDMGSTMSIDVAWLKSSHFAKAHSGATAFKTKGTFSTDSGKTWTGFATQPTGTTSGGTRALAFSANGSTLLWCAPGSSNPHWSSDLGTTWTASTGLTLGASAIGSAVPLADRADDKLLHVFDRLNGLFYSSRDGGQSFAKSSTTFTSSPSWGVSGSGVTVPAKAGHIWITTGAGTAAQQGLWHSNNGGTSFTRIASVTNASTIAVGMAAPKAAYPALYIWGTVGGVTGIFRSIDSAKSWERLNDAQHQFGIIHQMVGDPRVFGRVYLATEGRGILYGVDNSVPVGVQSLRRQDTRQLRHAGRFLESSQSITLHDIQGRLVRTSMGPESQARLDLAGLPQGIYFARSGAERLTIQPLR
ncbi:MAG: hypothetical protein RL318_2089 [Fibrobacterota bacterium]|jgi:hypothetical protein